MATPALLAEMVRQAERVLDQQLRLIAEQDDKAEQMLRLGVIALAGGAALAAFGVSNAGNDLGPGSVLWLSAGAVSYVASLMFFVNAYVGLGIHTEAIAVGPSVATLASMGRDTALTVAGLRLALLESAPEGWESRSRHLDRSTRSMGRGVHWLVFSVVSYGLAYAFIVARLVS